MTRGDGRVLNGEYTDFIARRVQPLVLYARTLLSIRLVNIKISQSDANRFVREESHFGFAIEKLRYFRSRRRAEMKTRGTSLLKYQSEGMRSRWPPASSRNNADSRSGAGRRGAAQRAPGSRLLQLQ